MIMKIAYIGGGNMARALIGGALKRGFSADDISVVEIDLSARNQLAQQFAVRVDAQPGREVESADVVLLAISWISFRITPAQIHRDNHFSWAPVKEVAILFAGIFITMIPALVVIGLGLDPLKILVLSQVVLSFALPFALVPLIMLTRRANVMQELSNSRVTNWLAYITTGVIIALNILLLYNAFGGKF